MKEKKGRKREEETDKQKEETDKKRGAEVYSDFFLKKKTETGRARQGEPEREREVQ